MIMFLSVCDHCGEQQEIPEECKEEQWRAKEKGIKSPTKAIKVIFNCFAVKSYTSSKPKLVKPQFINEFTFCSSNCVIEYIKKNLSEDGEFKYKIKDEDEIL